jgi:hypothetical protein
MLGNVTKEHGPPIIRKEDKYKVFEIKSQGEHLGKEVGLTGRQITQNNEELHNSFPCINILGLSKQVG